VARPLGGVMAEDVLLESPSLGKSCSTVGLLTGEGAKTQMHLITVSLHVDCLREEHTTRAALESLLLEVDISEVALHVAKTAENVAA